jgi:hypothetical protein
MFLLLSLSQKYTFRLVLVVHTCNPGYSGGRDQEIAIQSQPEERLYLEKAHHKTRLAE